jgi:hypothetical protein
MIIGIIITTIVILIIVYSCCNISGKCSDNEEKYEKK